MANDTNKDVFEDPAMEYEKQRLSFLSDLRRFNSNRGTPFTLVPDIGGQEIDLYYLYQKVTSLGGWQKVNNEQRWEDFQEEFGLPRACTNSAQVLKHIYFRYLNLYEKVNFLGEVVDMRSNEDEDGPARKKICLPIESIPLSYNYTQHKLNDATRQQLNLPDERPDHCPYEHIEMSLQSGLPNEVDVALNICILLSTEGKHTMKLGQTNLMLRLLLAHVGIFEDEYDDLQELYKAWTQVSERNYLRFWSESVTDEDIKKLITWQGRPFVQRELIGSDVLNLGRDLGTLDPEGQRALQLAVFLYNLSFEEDNQRILASSSAVFKFLMLSLHNSYGNLRQLALDTLANLACEFRLNCIEDLSRPLMVQLLNKALYSEDRFFLVRGLEILSKVCQLTSNEDILSEQLREDVYSRLVALLTVQDIQLIVHTLEALYKLSKVGEPFTTRIARVHRAIDTLVSLITIEAQSFGPGSLVGIKVVEYVPPVEGAAANQDGDTVRRATTVIQPINPDSVNIYQVQPSGHSAVDGEPGKPTNQPVKTPAKPPPPPEPITDIHATTISWLNATYEVKKKSKVNQVELFSDYLQFFRKFGLSNPMSSAEFLQSVKVQFEGINVSTINRKNGDTDVFYENLSKRQQQKPFAVTTLPPEKVRNPLSVNVSPHQQPPVLDPLAHTPTLRQRLMEPPRMSLSSTLPHAGAPVTTASKTPAGPQKPLTATPVRSGGTQTAQIKVVKAQRPPATPAQSGLVKAAMASQGLSPLAPASHSVQSVSGTTAQSFPSLTHALQGEQSSSSDAVKSLLAKKLSQGMDLDSHPGSSHMINSSSVQQVGQHLPSVTVSSQAPSQHNFTTSRPAVQMVISTSTVAPSTVSSRTAPVSSSVMSTTTTTTTQHVYPSGTSPQSVLRPAGENGQLPTNVHIQAKNGSVLQGQMPTINGPSNQIIAQAPLVQTNNLPNTHNVSSNVKLTQADVSGVVQQQPVFQTNTPAIVAQQQHVTAPIVRSNQNFATAFHPQCSSSSSSFVSSSSSAPSIALNHMIRNPSTSVLMSSTQQGQTISSPAVAALLTTSTVPTTQVLLSNPTQVLAQNQLSGGTTVVQQRPSTAPGQQVVIQSAQGTIVMPRQVLVQGNTGTATLGSIQQAAPGQGGTVSFIVPPQYRPANNTVTVQGLNLIQQPGGGVVLTTPVTAAQTPQGPRQIVLAHNPNNLPVGMPLSSVVQNSVNTTLCITGQQTQQGQQSTTGGFVLQQAPGQQLTVPSIPQAATAPSRAIMQGGQQQTVVQVVAQTAPTTGVGIESQPSILSNNNNQISTVVTGHSRPPAQCNGINHELNGVVNSPDSVKSDFPPSPLSTGSKGDMVNGTLTDTDKEALLKRNEIGKLMDKAYKINGYVHSPAETTNGVPPGKNDSKVCANNMPAEVANGQQITHHTPMVNGCVASQSQNGTTSVGPNQSNQLGVQHIVQSKAGGITQQVIGTPQQIQQHQQQLQLQQQQQQKKQAQQFQQHQAPAQNQQQPQQTSQNQVQRQASPAPPQSSTPRPGLAGAQGFLQHQPTVQRIQSAPTTQQTGPRPQVSAVPASGQVVNKPGEIKAGGVQTNRVAVGPDGKRKLPVKRPPEPVQEKQLLLRSRVKKPGTVVQTGQTRQGGMEYMCEWGACRRCFASARLVFLHVFRTHLPSTAESSCQWAACEKLVRKRWSLVSHVQDHHCSEMGMRTALQRRLAANQSQANNTPAPPAPPQPMIYPPDAAMQAIRRFSVKPPYPEFAEQREGPVSKHVRLTAALILRNICRYSSSGRRQVRRHEQLLSYHMMNTVEASTALSHCLGEVLKHCDRPPIGAFGL